MALVRIKKPVFYPQILPLQTAGSLIGGYTLDAVGDGDGICAQIRPSMFGRTIRAIVFGINAVSVAGDLNVRIERNQETADLIASPQGVLAAPGSESTLPLTDGGFPRFVLDTDYTIQQGDNLFVFAEVPSGSNFVGSTMHYRRHPWGDTTGIGPYQIYNTTGTWQARGFNSSNVARPTIKIELDDGSFLPGFCNAPDEGGVQDYRIDAGEEWGLKIEAPANWEVESMRVGLRTNDVFTGKIIVGNSSYLPGDTGATVLSERTIGQWAGVGEDNTCEFPFNDVVEMETGQVYYFVFRIETGFCRVKQAMYLEEAWREQLGVEPVKAHHTVENHGDNSWVDEVLKVPQIGLGIIGMQDGAGGGGGSVISQGAKVWGAS